MCDYSEYVYVCMLNTNFQAEDCDFIVYYL